MTRAQRVRRWLARGLVAFVLLLAAAGTLLVALGLPNIAAGMAAKAVCSAVFVAGREPDGVVAADVRPANPLFAFVDVAVDRADRSVQATFAGQAARRARALASRGCVLDVARPAFVPGAGAAAAPQGIWPDGDLPLPETEWGVGVDARALRHVVANAFVGAGDPEGTNTRAVAVLQAGRPLVLRSAPGFDVRTPLHGWSMTKTVGAMLLHALAHDTDLALDTPVVTAFPPGRAPAWVAAWNGDERRTIRVSDLLYMRDGLANDEGYTPWSAVPRMLWGVPDVATFAAAAPLQVVPGARWRYSSATANLLAAVARGRLPDDRAYWMYPRAALFDPIGARTALIETDPGGNWVASSFGWASVGDWARLGELLRADGEWQGRQVLPPGFLRLARTPSVEVGPGHAYGAQTWLIGDPADGDCKGYALPADTLAMAGHWGQIVAVIPSRQAVIVRLGWTFRKERFDPCRFVADVAAALR